MLAQRFGLGLQNCRWLTRAAGSAAEEGARQGFGLGLWLGLGLGMRIRVSITVRDNVRAWITANHNTPTGGHSDLWHPTSDI